MVHNLVLVHNSMRAHGLIARQDLLPLPPPDALRAWIHGCPDRDIVRREVVDVGLRSPTTCHATGRRDTMDSRTKHGRHAASDARRRPRCATDDEHVITGGRGEPGGKTKRKKHMTNTKRKKQRKKNGARSKKQTSKKQIKGERKTDAQTHRRTDRQTDGRRDRETDREREREKEELS